MVRAGMTKIFPVVSVVLSVSVVKSATNIETDFGFRVHENARWLTGWMNSDRKPI
jgi:hypothetical protein